MRRRIDFVHDQHVIIYFEDISFEASAADRYQRVRAVPQIAASISRIDRMSASMRMIICMIMIMHTRAVHVHV